MVAHLADAAAAQPAGEVAWADAARVLGALVKLGAGDAVLFDHFASRAAEELPAEIPPAEAASLFSSFALAAHAHAAALDALAAKLLESPGAVVTPPTLPPVLTGHVSSLLPY